MLSLPTVLPNRRRPRLRVGEVGREASRHAAVSKKGCSVRGRAALQAEPQRAAPRNVQRSYRRRSCWRRGPRMPCVAAWALDRAALYSGGLYKRLQKDGAKRAPPAPPGTMAGGALPMARRLLLLRRGLARVPSSAHVVRPPGKSASPSGRGQCGLLLWRAFPPHKVVGHQRRRRRALTLLAACAEAD